MTNEKIQDIEKKYNELNEIVIKMQQDISLLEEVIVELNNSFVKKSDSEFEQAYLDRRYPYTSQVGQDKFLNEVIFQDKKRGFFIDIGAHDGYSFSNSYFFEDKLGWNGICIEPNPIIFEELAKRRACTCQNLAVSSIDGIIKFIKVAGSGVSDMFSCIYNEDTPQEHLENIKVFEAQGCSTEIIDVQSKPLSKIMDESHCPQYIDFISIDTEGFELDVLKTIDFDKYTIGAFTIENNSGQDHLKEFLSQKGYKYIQTLGDLDEVFIKE